MEKARGLRGGDGLGSLSARAAASSKSLSNYMHTVSKLLLLLPITSVLFISHRLMRHVIPLAFDSTILYWQPRAFLDSGPRQCAASPTQRRCHPLPTSQPYPRRVTGEIRVERRHAPFPAAAAQEPTAKPRPPATSSRPPMMRRQSPQLGQAGALPAASLAPVASLPPFTPSPPASVAARPPPLPTAAARGPHPARAVAIRPPPQARWGASAPPSPRKGGTAGAPTHTPPPSPAPAPPPFGAHSAARAWLARGRRGTRGNATRRRPLPGGRQGRGTSGCL